MRQADVGFDPETTDPMITPGLWKAFTRVISGVKGLGLEDPFDEEQIAKMLVICEELTTIRDRFGEDGRLIAAE